MAYSGTYTFDLSIDEICEEAFERCGVEVRSGYDLRTARRSLNLIFLEWANRGLNLWTIDDTYVDMVIDQNSYSLDAKVLDLLETTITAGPSTDASAYATDIQIMRVSRAEYFDLAKKGTSARPTMWYLHKSENTPTLYVYPSPEKAYRFKYYYLSRIQDAGVYTNNAEVPFNFLPCLTAALAYYISLKRSPMLSANLKASYDEEFSRAAGEDQEMVSFKVVPYNSVKGM